MAKTSGLGDNFYFAGWNISNDTASLESIHGGNTPIDMTGIDVLANERVGGKRDGGFSWTSYLNPTNAHLALSGLPTTDILGSYFRGTGIGNAAACCRGLQIDYQGHRNADGSMTFTGEIQSDDFGFEWGSQLTAGVRTDTTPTNGAALDQVTVSTAFGWQAYLHVFAVTGTSVTVTLQDSADNSTFAGLASGAFTAVTPAVSGTAAAWQRINGGATDTVRRYVRAITSGTFTSASFAVVFMRNLTAVSF